MTPRGGAVVARWAHNPKVVGSNPAPATNAGFLSRLFLFKIILSHGSDIRRQSHHHREQGGR